MNHFRLVKRSLVAFVLFSLFMIVLSLRQGHSQNVNVEIPGVDGPYVTIYDKSVMIAFAFEEVELDVGGRFAIPKFPNSYAELTPDLETDGTLLIFYLDVLDLLNDKLKFLDPLTLPGGRPLPGIRRGELPALAFTVPQFHDLSFYIGRKVFGVFVPFNIDLRGSIATFRFYVEEERAGNISLVGEDRSGENGGLLLLLNLSKYFDQ